MRGRRSEIAGICDVLAMLEDAESQPWKTFAAAVDFCGLSTKTLDDVVEKRQIVVAVTHTV
ncbi:MAG TPA: hypothetical protein VHV75_16100 [Solirubrobacteraceae bacterium]|nr:hypothetical protein [Solirubrobacteraceae bacterium]